MATKLPKRTPKAFLLVHEPSGLTFEIIKGGGTTWGNERIPYYHWCRLYTPNKFSRCLAQFDNAADLLKWISDNALQIAAKLTTKEEN